MKMLVFIRYLYYIRLWQTPSATSLICAIFSNIFIRYLTKLSFYSTTTSYRIAAHQTAPVVPGTSDPELPTLIGSCSQRDRIALYRYQVEQTQARQDMAMWRRKHAKSAPLVPPPQVMRYLTIITHICSENLVHYSHCIYIQMKMIWWILIAE